MTNADYLFLPLFALIATVYLYIAMNVRFWRVLARQYPFDPEAFGTTFRCVSMRTGIEPYCMTVVVSDDAMTFKPILLFRLLHPPLTLRRSEMHHIAHWRFIFFHSVSFYVNDQEVTLFGKIAQNGFWQRLPADA